jgi:hypothetical protein
VLSLKLQTAVSSANSITIEHKLCTMTVRCVILFVVSFAVQYAPWNFLSFLSRL